MHAPVDKLPGAEEVMKQKILFFIAGPNPTANEFAAAEKIGTTTFRYAGAIRPIDSIERCDAVAGDPDVIPETYKAAYPVVEPSVPEPSVPDPKDDVPTSKARRP